MKYLLLLALLLIVSVYAYDRILIREVTSVILSEGQMTKGRRGSPIPQLTCIGNCHGFKPETVMCKNVGFDGRDVTWKCEADLPNNLRFGKMSVSCEGYDYPDDPYILVGSCGLEYSLVGSNSGNNAHSSHDSSYRQNETSTTFMGSFVFYAIVAFILYQCFSGRRNASPHDNGGGGGAGAPPPYPGGGSGGFPPKATYTQNTGSSWTPGFWSGLATGGVLGHAMGSRNNNSYGGGGYSTRSYGGGSSSFGGGSSGGSSSRSGYASTTRR